MKNKVVFKNGIKITGTTLLTVEEAKKLPEEMWVFKDWWWLRSPGSSGDSAAFVYSDGSIDYDGLYVNCDIAVRPALELSELESSDFAIGDKFRFGNKEFEIISDTRALCTEDIGNCAFREDWKVDDANDYETSDIKKFVNIWYKKSAKENKINFCDWTLFDNAVSGEPLWTYSTGCGKYVSEDKTDNDFIYCPYCSGKIKLINSDSSSHK